MTAPRIIDISPIISPRTAVWPGDVPFRREVSFAIEQGHNIDLSAIRTTLHVGAHADAPSHCVRHGQSIADRALELYFGPCEVVEVSVPRGARIRPADLPAGVRSPRVLFKTGSFPDSDSFATDFNSLSPELLEWLNDCYRVRLVGIDTPSIDPFDDKDLLSHHALARFDMANLEGLVLAHVPPGNYTLAALPLRIEGADASPVRAVLVAY